MRSQPCFLASSFRKAAASSILPCLSISAARHLSSPRPDCWRNLKSFSFVTSPDSRRQNAPTFWQAFLENRYDRDMTMNDQSVDLMLSGGKLLGSPAVGSLMNDQHSIIIFGIRKDHNVCGQTLRRCDECSGRLAAPVTQQCQHMQLVV
eukprot:scpid75697/ scgid29353/ 